MLKKIWGIVAILIVLALIISNLIKLSKKGKNEITIAGLIAVEIYLLNMI